MLIGIDVSLLPTCIFSVPASWSLQFYPTAFIAHTQDMSLCWVVLDIEGNKAMNKNHGSCT